MAGHPFSVLTILMSMRHAVAVSSLSVWKDDNTSGLPGFSQGNRIGPGLGAGVGAEGVGLGFLTQCGEGSR